MIEPREQSPLTPESRPRAQEKRVPKERTVSQPVPSTVRSIAEAIVMKDQNLFFLSRPDGIVPLEAHHGFGLYYNDCRYLSGYALTLGGTVPSPLVSSSSRGYVSLLQLSNEEFVDLDGKPVGKENLGIKWKRVIDGERITLWDSLTVQNFSVEPVRVELALEFDSTFEDVFVVRGMLQERRGAHSGARWEGNTLSFVYRGQDQIRRAVLIRFGVPPDDTQESVARFHLSLGPQQTQEIPLTITITEDEGKDTSVPQPSIVLREMSKVLEGIQRNYREWHTHEAHIESDSWALNQTIDRSFQDLRMLESHQNGSKYFAAGVPWFSTLFGRDSIITALQTLAFNSHLAEGTLRLLAQYQGKKRDEWRDEAPGKILHELRLGELARLGLIPHTPYYGTVDATPLFLVLLARHAEWTGDLNLFLELQGAVEKALDWIDAESAQDKQGFLSYSCRSTKGLTNQGWKDSWDGIMDRDGSLVTPPVGLVEVQGYVYAAKLGIATLYDLSGDAERARELREQATELRRRFNREFWMQEDQFLALALYGDGLQARAFTSNAGHALWSGILDRDKASAVAERLLDRDLYSGWGIRTLAESSRRYNPLGYHLGTVWPHDNALIAAGLKRYRFNDAVSKLFTGIFRASTYFENNRLPELFAGFSEEEYGVPVNYPVACRPQAWAAGTIPQFIEVLLGLQPDAFAGRLRIVQPVLPSFVRRLEFKGLKVGDATVDLGFYRTQRSHVAVEVLRLEGPLEVSVEPAVAPTR